MAFTVTARHVGNSDITGVQTQATNSTTPTADSLLLLGWGSERDNTATAQTWQTPTGGGLTYTSIAQSSESAWVALTQFSLKAGMWQAPVGSSPSAFAITVDAFSGTELATYDVRACDITGHDTGVPVVQSKANGASVNPVSDTAAGTVTFDNPVTAGNLLVVYFSSGDDTASTPASPTAGGGKTFTQVSVAGNRDTNGGMWYRVADGAESQTITCADLGTQVGNYGAIAVEIRAGSGVVVDANQARSGPLPWRRWYRVRGMFKSTYDLLTEQVPLAGQTLNVTDSAGLTDAALLERGLVVTDSVGLTDAAALTAAPVITDSAGLTDTSLVELSKLLAVTDSAGLTDSSALEQQRVVTDSVGLTDTQPITRSAVFTDSAGLTDTTLVELSKLISVTDDAGLTDSALLSQTKTVTDSAGLTDGAVLDQTKVVTDSAGLTDTSALSSGRLLDVTDTVGLTDSQALSRTLVNTDSAGLTDAAALTVAKVATDSAGLTDSVAAGILRDVTTTDSVGLTDSQTFARSLGVTDSVGLTDAANLAQLHILTDSAGLTDAASVILSIPQAFFEGVLTGGVRAGPSATGGTRVGPNGTGHVLLGTLDFYLDIYGDVYVGGEGTIPIGTSGAVKPGAGVTGGQLAGTSVTGGSR